MNMKRFGRRNVSKHREIKNGERCITLDISLKFGSPDKMKITYSDPKYYLGRPGKALINFLGLNSIGRSKKKKEIYSITNVSMKYLSNIIREF